MYPPRRLFFNQTLLVSQNRFWTRVTSSISRIAHPLRVRKGRPTLALGAQELLRRASRGGRASAAVLCSASLSAWMAAEHRHSSLSKASRKSVAGRGGCFRKAPQPGITQKLRSMSRRPCDSEDGMNPFPQKVTGSRLANRADIMARLRP